MDLIFRAWDAEDRRVSIIISEAENGLFNKIVLNENYNDYCSSFSYSGYSSRFGEIETKEIKKIKSREGKFTLSDAWDAASKETGYIYLKPSSVSCVFVTVDHDLFYLTYDKRDIWSGLHEFRLTRYRYPNSSAPYTRYNRDFYVENHSYPFYSSLAESTIKEAIKLIKTKQC